MRHLLAALVLITACKGGKGTPGGGGSHAGSATTSGGTTARADELIRNAKGPEGVAWKRTELPFGTAEIPSGDGWTLADGQLEHTDGTVIMFQSQSGVDASQLADYLASYDAVQKRDAPKYAETAHQIGTIKGTAAARVEGTFDNGTKFVTHDYILIAPSGTVAMVGGRMPEGPGPNTRLALLVDHIAATAQIK